MKQGSNSQLLIFKIGDQFFAAQLENIKEIVENKELYPIPVDSPHIIRIFIHRNEAIAVLNTEYYFNTSVKKSNYHIVFEDLIALPADELGGIFNSNQFDNGNKDIKSQFVKEIFYINDKPVSVIDYKELSLHEGKALLFPI